MTPALTVINSPKMQMCDEVKLTVWIISPNDSNEPKTFQSLKITIVAQKLMYFLTFTAFLFGETN